ncbi:MAG: virulence protein RhuM/Fic/DOC family protein [Oligoflexia bacterium]|nr:virulence protein RhuM/Fic/DOC family protein [Oligoflexia bacterium]
MKKGILIYQSKNGKIEFQWGLKREDIWTTQAQISKLFKISQPVVSRHINNIFKDKEADKKSNMQKMHIANSDKPISFYSLAVILSVGYRANSKLAVEFREWTTKVLKQHLLEGWTINKKQLLQNYQKFQKTVEDIKTLLPTDQSVPAQSALELISVFASTWFSLEAYDKENFPTKGWTKKQVSFTAEELKQSLDKLKKELIAKKQATDLFGQKKIKSAVSGIVGNVFQTFGGQDLYPTIEEKSAHLLYFMVKNHPFTDGNKRSGAFAFIWFLKKAGRLSAGLSPSALTALTLLVAESNPKDKDKMIGVVLLLLERNQEQENKR